MSETPTEGRSELQATIDKLRAMPSGILVVADRERDIVTLLVKPSNGAVVDVVDIPARVARQLAAQILRAADLATPIDIRVVDGDEPGMETYYQRVGAAPTTLGQGDVGEVFQALRAMGCTHAGVSSVTVDTEPATDLQFAVRVATGRRAIPVPVVAITVTSGQTWKAAADLMFSLDDMFRVDLWPVRPAGIDLHVTVALDVWGYRKVGGP